MFLMYLRLPHWRNSASNDSEAFNSRSKKRSNRAFQDSPEAEGRSPHQQQIQQQQVQRLRQIEANYYLERRLFW